MEIVELQAITVANKKAALPPELPTVVVNDALEFTRHRKLTTLANGLQLISIKSVGSPLASVRLHSRCGIDMNPTRLSLLSRYLLDALSFDAYKNKTSRQIYKERYAGQRQFKNKKKSVEMGWGAFGSFVDKQLLASELDDYLIFLREEFLQPKFEESIFRKSLFAIKKTVYETKYNPTRLAYQHLIGQIYPLSHPYAKAYNLSKDLNNKNLASVRKDIIRCWQPKNLILTIAGDLSNEQLLDVVSQSFGGWNNSEKYSERNIVDVAPYRETNKESSESPANELSIHIKNKDDSVQTEILVGVQSVSRGHPDYPFLQLLASILGDNHARLFNDLREKQGLTYAVNAYQQEKFYPGLFVLTSRSRYPQMPALLDGMLQHLSHLTSHPVSQSELDIARNNLKFELLGKYESDMSLVNLFSLRQTWRLKEQESERLIDAWNNATPEKLAEVASHYFNQPSIVLVGDKSKIQTALNGRMQEYRRIFD